MVSSDHMAAERHFVDQHGSYKFETKNPVPIPWNHQNNETKKNMVTPSLAKKLSLKAAMLGALVMQPMQCLMSQMSGTVDLMEIACSPCSSLSSEMEAHGFSIHRVNYKSGFDLESKNGTWKLRQEIQTSPPRMMWVSLPCTRLTSLTNLTQRTEEEWANFHKRQQRDLKRADEVSQGVCDGLELGSDFAWEWPTGAAKGWKARCISRLVQKLRQLQRPVYWCRFHGCAYGLEFNGVPVLKSWTVLTSNRGLWLSLQRKCPGHPHHAECRGPVAQASAYY